jgi:hypothetical protein
MRTLISKLMKHISKDHIQRVNRSATDCSDKIRQGRKQSDLNQTCREANLTPSIPSQIVVNFANLVFLMQQNKILGQILHMLISRQCFMMVKYIRSADNPADPPSRGIFTDTAKQTTFHGFPAGYSGIISRIK